MPRPRKVVPRRHARRHGQGSVVAHGDGWRAFRAPSDGKRESRVFDDREAAERWAAGGALSTRPTLGAWLDHWLAQAWPRLGANSQPTYRRHVAACRSLSEIPIDLISEDDWQALVNELLTVWSRATVNAWLLVIRGAVKRAIPRYLTYNPLGSVKLPKATEQPPKAWRKDEVARLLATARGGTHETWLLFSLATGVRIAEALAVERTDLDLTEQTVTISKQVLQVDRTLAPTKTGKVRVIDLPAEILPALVAYLARLPAGQQRLFPRTAASYREWLQRVCKRAGVSVLTPHATRHTAASLALDAGVPIQDVARLLGHATPATTMRVYASFLGDGQRRAARALGSALLGGFQADNEPTAHDLHIEAGSTR